MLSARPMTTRCRTYASTGRWAEHTNELIGRFFDKAGRGTFLDIGANIGLTTIPVARRANVACHAFEPEPENFRNLRTRTFAPTVPTPM